MAKRQSRFMVGLFVTSGLLIGVAAVIWLGAANYCQKGARYVTYFDESVQGLQVDSRVKYRGVEVGSVEWIGVAPDQRLVEVVVKIDLEGDVERSMVAQLKAAGITGIVFVELDRRLPEAEVFVPPAGMKTAYPVIPSQPSQTKQMLSSIDRIMEKVVRMDLDGVAEHIKRSASAIETFFSSRDTMRTVRNLESLSASLGRSRGRIDSLLAAGKMEAVLAEVEGGAKEARQGIGEAREGIGEIRRGVGAAREGITEIRQLISLLEREVKDLKTAELSSKSQRLIEGVDRRTKEMAYDFQATADDIRQAVDSLKMLIESLRENPSDLLFSEPVRDRGKRKE